MVTVATQRIPVASSQQPLSSASIYLLYHQITLEIAEKKREAKGTGGKERYPSECRVPVKSKDKKSFLTEHCKEIVENTSFKWKDLRALQEN